MNYDLIFQWSNTVALISWILLMLFPFKGWTTKVLTGFVIAALAILYLCLLVLSFNFSDLNSFNTLGGLKGLFSSDISILTGWIHYLAFDLMTGLYIANNAKKHEINQLILIPCLLLTFITGPVGLLLYLIVRTIKTRKYFLSYA